MVAGMTFDNRVTDLLGVDVPIFQAPMGYVAKPPLVAAVSEAGAMGLIPGSLGTDVTREDIHRTRELTSKPFGVNLPLAFLRDPDIVDMIVDEGIEFVTTSAGSPDKYGPLLKEAGLIVFHVVPTLKGAQRAVDAGVDGLVVEGSEGAGFKNPRDVTSMVLLPLIATEARRADRRRRRDRRRSLDGGRVRARRRGRADGHPDAVVGGVRRALEHEAGRARRRRDRHDADQPAQQQAGARAAHADDRAVRARRPRATRWGCSATPCALYEDGEFEGTLPQLGAVAGRIDEILPAAEIIRRTVEEFEEMLGRLAERYVAARAGRDRLMPIRLDDGQSVRRRSSTGEQSDRT